MLNVVELVTDEHEDAPCKWGNIVVDHACYCHRDDWKEGPRKCPIWRNFGTSDLIKWHKRDWPSEEVWMHRPELPERRRLEMRPCFPDDDIGGCPMFEPTQPAVQKTPAQETK